MFGPVLVSLLAAGAVAAERGLASRVNEGKHGWTAKEGSVQGAQYRMGVLPERAPPRWPPKPVARAGRVSRAYDFRKAFGNCSRSVSDGGRCASGWAVVPAGVLGDRACRGGVRGGAAPTRLLACCGLCGAGCFGGYPWLALGFLRGAGTAPDACQPFLLGTPSDPFRARTPGCPYRSCRSKNETYRTVAAKDYYSVPPEDIQKEIMTRGPVVSYIKVYEDLLVYSEGVYEHVAGKLVGHETVALVGWGEEGNKSFWLAEVPWGSSWGRNGTLRVARGNHRIGIERNVMALTPLI